MKVEDNITLYLIVLVIFGASCSGGGIETESFNLPEEATLELKERFRISEPAEGAFFSSIRKIHILADGNLVVQNYPDHQLYELNDEGELIQVIGRKGRGPGEFIETFISHLMTDDSLHVFDFNNMRHQVLVKNEEGNWEYVRERVFKRVLQKEMVEQIPNEVISGPDGAYYGIFQIFPGSIYPGSRGDTLNAHYKYVARVDLNVEHVGEVSRLRLEEDLAIHRTETSSTTINNGRFFQAFYQYDPIRDEVLYIKNTSNKIIGIDSAGKEYVKGHLPFERFPLDQEKLEPSLENVNYHYSGMEKIVQKKLLPHEPFFWNVVLDEDRLWVQLARSEVNKPNWIITSLDGEVLESFHGPKGIGGVTIRDNRMYGAIKDSDGATYLAAFELIESGKNQTMGSVKPVPGAD